jgi:hypothetical protein
MLHVVNLIQIIFILQVLEKAKGVYESIGKAIGQDYVDSLLNALEK